MYPIPPLLTKAQRATSLLQETQQSSDSSNWGNGVGTRVSPQTARWLTQSDVTAVRSRKTHIFMKISWFQNMDKTSIVEVSLQCTPGCHLSIKSHASEVPPTPKETGWQKVFFSIPWRHIAPTEVTWHPLDWGGLFSYFSGRGTMMISSSHQKITLPHPKRFRANYFRLVKKWHWAQMHTASFGPFQNWNLRQSLTAEYPKLLFHIA